MHTFLTVNGEKAGKFHRIRQEIPTLTAFDFSAPFPEFSSATAPVCYSLSIKRAFWLYRGS